MKLQLIVIVLILFSTKTNCQQSFCADSSYRIKYTFGTYGATLYTSPDTTGKNYFAGWYQEGFGTKAGIALMKTTWGDSIIWAKKLFVPGVDISTINCFSGPNGSLIAVGNYGGAFTNNPELLVCKFDTNGVVYWMKRLSYNQVNLHFATINKPVLVTNNAIYITANFNDLSNTVTKLDLNGNILWSSGFWMNGPLNTFLRDASVIDDSAVFISGSTTFGSTYDKSLILKLNDANGTIDECYAYKVVQNAFVKGVFALNLTSNTDNNFTISGLITTIFSGSPAISNSPFNILLDAQLNPLINYYYTNSLLNNGYDWSFNSLNQQVLLGFDPNTQDKYFMTLDKDYRIKRTRKFNVPANVLYDYSVNLDDKQNIHFAVPLDENNKLVTDYARISNLAPNSTLNCFGKDTSIFTQHPFTVTKENFTWDNIQYNVIDANDVPFQQNITTVTKEVVCKIVSYCDTIKINGPAAACVGAPVRYTIRRNNTCLKNTDWSIDTTFANITSLEGDSAITLIFKKPFNGYIHAALSDCVVKDSFLVKAVVPSLPPLINRTDSLLCPGKTLTLTTNNGYSNYVWNGIVSSQQFTVNNAGTYRVTATDSCGVLRADSIAVTLSDTSLTLATLPAVCLYDTAFISLPNNVSNIVWQPTANSLLRGNTIVAYPAQSTLFTVTAQRQTNCPITRQVVVTIKSCPQTFYMPNSFTPNNDGLNDKFKPTISQLLAAYRLTIYNRYGQTIFTTTDQYKAWDGTFKGSSQPMGGYIYQCSYRFNNGDVKNVNGYFMLLR